MEAPSVSARATADSEIVEISTTDGDLRLEVRAEPGELAESSRDTAGLSELETRMLDFERKWWRYAGAKEQAVGELFGVSSTRYYQLLNALIDTPAALAYDAMLVKRLRRMRQTRQRARSARRAGAQ